MVVFEEGLLFSNGLEWIELLGWGTRFVQDQSQFYIQEFVQDKYDLRTHVLNPPLLFSMKVVNLIKDYDDVGFHDL